MKRWRMVVSNKPQRKGEAFILYGDLFVLKVYRISNATRVAQWIVDLLNGEAPGYIEPTALEEEHHEH